MKKLLLTVLILTLSLAVLLIFTGCNKENKPLEPEDVDLDAMDSAERAELLMAASERRLAAAESYEEDLRADILASGQTVVRIMGTDKVTGAGTEAYKHRTVTTTTVMLNGANVTQIATEGYGNGYMYSTTSSDAGSLELRSELTVQEYLNYRGRSIADLSAFGGSVEVETEKSEDGTWRIILSDFDGDSIDSFLAAAGMSSITSQIDIAAIDVAMGLDENFYPKSTEIGIYRYEKPRYPYLSPSKIKLIEMEIEYKNINSAKIVDPNISSYREIEDLAVLRSTQQGISELASKRSGHFAYHMYTSRVTSTHTAEADDRREINYQIDNDGNIKFDMDSVIDGVATYYFYESGKMSQYSAKGGAFVKDYEMMNDKAKNTVLQLQCFHAFDVQQFVDMRIGENENEYVFTMNLTDEIVNKYTTLNLEDVKGEKTYEMTVVLDDGYNIVSYTVDMNIAFSNRTYTVRGTYELKE